MMTFLSYLFLVMQLLFAFFFFYLCLAFVTGAPFVPSTNPVSRAMIRLAGIHKGSVIYDLGSGDGKLLFLAAKEGAKAYGLEINPFLVLYSNIRALFSPYRGLVRTKWKNFWNADLSDADILFIYLLPWKMDKLEDRLKKTLKKGTLIVSNSFIFPSLKCVRKDESLHVFVFRI